MVWKVSGVFLPILKKLDEWHCTFHVSFVFLGYFLSKSGNPHPCCVEPLEAQYVGASWALPFKYGQSKIACSDLAARVVRWLCTECLPRWSPCFCWEGCFLVIHGGGCLADACVCLAVTVHLTSWLTIALMDNQRSNNFYSNSHMSSVAALWCFLQCQIICCGFSALFHVLKPCPSCLPWA